MNNDKLLSLLLLLLHLFIFFPATAQEMPAETIIKSIQPSMPLYANESTYYTLDDEIANIINDLAEELNLLDAFAGIEIDSSLQISISNSTARKIISFDILSSAYHEAIVVHKTNFFQSKIDRPDEESYFQLQKKADEPLIKKRGTSYSWFTEIVADLAFYNIATSEFLGNLEVTADGISKSAITSKSKAINALRKKLAMELKKIYWLSSEISPAEDGEMTIGLGSSHGVAKGELFELISADRIWSDGKKEYLIPSERIGFVSIADTAKDSSAAKILRQWRDYDPDSYVVEYPFSVYAVEFFCTSPSAASYVNFGLSFHAKPLRNFDWGFGTQFVRLTDSFNQNSYGIGFNGFVL